MKILEDLEIEFSSCKNDIDNRIIWMVLKKKQKNNI